MATSMMYSYDLQEKKNNAPKVKSVLKDLDVKKKDKNEYDNALDRGEIEMVNSKREKVTKVKLEDEGAVEVNDDDFEIGSPDKFGPPETKFHSEMENKVEDVDEEDVSDEEGGNANEQLEL